MGGWELPAGELRQISDFLQPDAKASLTSPPPSPGGIDRYLNQRYLELLVPGAVM